MKILFIARATLYVDRGGDTVQILKTAEYLRELGVEVDIRLTTETIDYSGYQLLHFFNIIRPADILRHIDASSKPFVVSTVYVDYSEADRNTRKGLTKLLSRCFSQEQVEYLKVIARLLINGERIMSPSYVLYGQRQSIRRILRNAALLLPNSASEYHRLEDHFRTKSPYRVIPNAIDATLFTPAANAPPREKDLVICAGRIEGRKNQLNLIKAINGSSFRLILIGAPAVNQQAYYEECIKTAGPSVGFVGPVTPEELAQYYCRAAVHALPSWFETTGLSSLEAAAMGCSIVITDKGDTREYFESYVCYCDPASPQSILNALQRAAVEGPSDILRQKVLTQYTWTQTAARTLDAYNEIIGT